tara:strand:- start:319 stop:669 length:351 start_codon:yes stop_codon:yes gene_type:complete
MIKLLAILIVTATVYNAVPEQTDSTPFLTASGSIINPECPEVHRWIAVSQDMLKEGWNFGECVEVTGAGDLDGVWQIQDVMNKRYNRSIDFLVENSRTKGKWLGVKIKITSEDMIV